MARNATVQSADNARRMALLERRRPHVTADTRFSKQMARTAMLFGRRKTSILGLALSSLIGALSEAGILAVAARAATTLVTGQTRVDGSLGPLHVHATTNQLLYVGLGLATVRLLMQIPNSVFPARIAGDVQASMRRELIDAYSHGSWELQSKGREGQFQEMMGNQIGQASQGTMQATALIISFATFCILVASAFALKPIAAISVFAAASILFALMRPANNLATKLSRLLSAAQMEYAGSVAESNRVTEETNVFGIADAQCKRVNGFIDASLGFYIKAQLLGRLIPNVYQSMIYFILILGLLAISFAGVTGFSSLGAVVLLLVRAGTYGQQVQSAWVSLRQSLPYVERIQNAIDSYRTSAPKPGDVGLERIDTLAFQHVEYYYSPDRPVLREMTWSVNRGETIGVVGPSGAGKSTMVQILLRLRTPRSGAFLINGIASSDLRAADWHERVAYVPQAPKLIHASVADNVRFFRDFDDAAVEHACRMARIHDEIMSWPEGYATIVGPRADAVSGGQQQRICLARALISQPSLLVLDEPTSALDPRSEALIQESLEALHEELTLFIIAHRMSTLTICDRVMVVLDGQLNAFDSLQELRDTNPYYRFASGIAAGLAGGKPADALLDEPLANGASAAPPPI